MQVYKNLINQQDKSNNLKREVLEKKKTLLKETSLFCTQL